MSRRGIILAFWAFAATLAFGAPARAGTCCVRMRCGDCCRARFAGDRAPSHPIAFANDLETSALPCSCLQNAPAAPAPRSEPPDTPNGPRQAGPGLARMVGEGPAASQAAPFSHFLALMDHRSIPRLYLRMERLLI